MKCVEPDGPDPGDAELLRRVKRGDTDAFAPVVRRHLPSLRAFVALHLPVPHLADEVATLVLASTTVWLLAQDPPAAAPLTEQQLKHIRPIVQGTQAETARAQARLAECQRKLAGICARYELDEASARKLQDEIVELQRQLLTSHHRLQKALRATVNADQFERLRRRLEQAAAPSPAASGQSTARPEATPRSAP